MVRTRFRSVAIGASVLVGGLGLAAVSPAVAASASAPTYVSLGDSYTSGPLIVPPAPGAPLDCLQSAVNYPHLTARALGLALTDRSCSGATTADLTTAQYSDQPPQDRSLSASTSVVTVGIGGNDNNLFVGALTKCAELDIGDVINYGAPCKAVYGNTFANDVAADAPVLGAAFAHIHDLAPKARVFVVGYPDILPQSGGCYPTVPLTNGDTAYLNGVEKDLNSALRSEAASEGATFVDTYTPSTGHDACQSEAVRWVEPPVPGTDAAPVHPNAAGEAATARVVETALRGAGIS